MTKNKKPSRIPEFKSIQEEAEFWDTHSLADYWDEFKPVKVRFARKLEHIFSVRFDGKTLTALQDQAEKKGIGAATLIRMWVRERLKQEQPRPAHA